MNRRDALGQARRVAGRARHLYRRLRFKALSVVRPKFIRSPYRVTLTGNWSDATFRLYATGGYGTFLQNFLLRQVLPFSFIDVGANQGLYSMIARQNPRCRKIYAFEPVARIADLMEENFRCNNCRDVTVIRSAVSDKFGQVNISFNPKHSGASSLASTNTDISSSAEHVLITLIDHTYIDRIIHTDGEQIIVKVDVEGHELVVIGELLKCTFAPSICAIFYECDIRWVSDAALRQQLAEHGFTNFKQIGEGIHYDVLATRPIVSALA